MKLKYRDYIADNSNNDRVDYHEIRIEETDSTRLVYKGRELDNISQNCGLGGNVRIAYKGAWAFSSFNSLSGIKNKIVDATNQARFIGDKKTVLAEVEPQIDSVKNFSGKDPNSISLAEKKRLMDHYLGLAWSVKGVSGSDIVYSDTNRKVYFGNSEGTYIDQQHKHVTFRISVQAREGGDVQQSGFSIGSLGDFNLVEGLDEAIIESTKKALGLLKSKSLRGGERTVVLDPVLAGVFIHEAFGHLSEADNVYENDKLKNIMYLGRKFGGKHLNFTDGARISGLRGSYKYDDEGTPASVTPLVRRGELVGRLHSRETAGKLDENPTGNARSINYAFPPIVRMTNTRIEPGEATFEDLLEGVSDGVYVKNWYGGMTQHEMFTFSSGEAYMIRNGNVEEPIRPVMLTGNLFSTLENLDGVANDIAMNQGGGCGKAGQSPLPVGTGSPHIRIRNCLISGG